MKDRHRISTTAVVAMLAFCLPTWAQKKADDQAKRAAQAEKAVNFPEALWHDPGDISKLNLLYGAGGRKHAPGPSVTYKFVREIMSGSTPKFDVEDEKGVRWRVKLGSEAETETAATRLLWAMGYFVDEDYYLHDIKVEDLLKLHRGQEYVSRDGFVHGARLERKHESVTELGTWNWSKNPFRGTRELNGLRVMMTLINNWDLKDLNNSIYAMDSERRYVVSDTGSSFGKTGAKFTRTENSVEDYAASLFVDKATPESVNFVMHTRPVPPMVVIFPVYIQGVRRENLGKHIPRADVQWLAAKLAQLSTSQIRDCFRAAGYPPEKVNGFSDVIQRRIAELKGL